MNLDEVEFDDIEENGLYTSKRGQISDHIGARRLGYNLTVVAPGTAQCPFHSHHAEEEMFLILDGEGELRFGDQRYPIRRHDVIACPTGGAEVAHQIINTGTRPLRYLALSTLAEVEACEYPDSQKILDRGRPARRTRLRKMFRAENTVDYYDREKTRALLTAWTPGPVFIRPLGADTLPLFLRFFDGDAFADNPKWSSCYPFYEVRNVVRWSERTSA